MWRPDAAGKCSASLGSAAYEKPSEKRVRDKAEAIRRRRKLERKYFNENVCCRPPKKQSAGRLNWHLASSV